MHPDTERLIALHKTDLQREKISSQTRALKEEVQSAAQKIRSAQQLEAQEQETLLQMQEREQTSNQRYEHYLKKARDTRNLLETGQIGNYEAGKTQLEQCLAIADSEETALLELMDEMESVQERIEARSRQVALRESQHLSKKETLDANLPGLQKAFSEAEELRLKQAQEVREDYLSLYEKIRQKLRHAVVTISDDACNSCGMGISSMPLAEHKRGSAVHRCPNCGRFLGEFI